jgi:spore germination cell wall hydrolase CwlJ-like protein
MEDNTIKDLVSDMLSNIVLGDKSEEEEVTSTGLMSSLPGIRTPTQVQQQDEQEAAPKARDKVKEFILRLSDEAEDTNSLRYSEKAAPEITDVMVDSETLLNRYATPLYVYARNLRDYNPERSTIKVRNRGDHSERFLDQMYELARQSSEEAALARMEMGITESLPRSAPRMGFDVQGLIDAVNRDMTLGVETEELDDEEVAILSDTDTITDDADGGAAPSDGKGLMAKPYDADRMKDINEPLTDFKIPEYKEYSSPYEMSDLEILARTIEAEARGEPFEGKIAVGAVIANRAASGSYGNNIKGVILRKGQFSPWNKYTGHAGGRQGKDMMKFRASKDSYKAANAILTGMYEDPTNGSTHYVNERVAEGQSWIQTMKNRKRGTVTIGNHLFGNADSNKKYDGKKYIENRLNVSLRPRSRPEEIEVASN